MKHRLSGVLLLTLCAIASGVYGQTVRASARIGNSPNSAIISIRPNFNFNNKLNEMGFVIRIPKENPPGTSIPMPAVTVLATCASCLNTTFPAAGWVQIQDVSSDPNFYLLKLGCVSNLGSAPTLTINNGVLQDVLEIQFTGSTVTPTSIQLAHIISGGPGTQYGFNITDGSSNDLTNYRQMFEGAGVVPAAPHPDDQTGYDNTQFVPLNGIILPLKFRAFNVIKNGNDAKLDWTVESQINNKSFDIERSINGIDFTKIGSTDKVPSASDRQDYTYTDPQIDQYGSSFVYYRIKQVDYDNKSSYSEIRSLRLNNKNPEVSVYPNPVVKGFYVNVPLDNADKQKVRLSLVNHLGQTIQQREITGQQAANYYFDLKGLSIAAGEYMLQVYSDGKITGVKKLVISKE